MSTQRTAKEIFIWQRKVWKRKDKNYKTTLIANSLV